MAARTSALPEELSRLSIWAKSLGCKPISKETGFMMLFAMVRAKEIQRVSRGVYGYSGKPGQQVSKQKIMWNYFRMRMKCGASVTIEELQAAAGVSKRYAYEWLAFLVESGFVKDHGNGKFQLLKDPVEMPVNEAKAQRLQRFTRKQTRGGDGDPGRDQKCIFPAGRRGRGIGGLT